MSAGGREAVSSASKQNFFQAIWHIIFLFFCYSITCHQTVIFFSVWLTEIFNLCFPLSKFHFPLLYPLTGFIWLLFLLFSDLMYRFLSDPDSSGLFCSQWGSYKSSQWIKSEAGSSKRGQRNSSFYWQWKQPAVSSWQAEFTWIHTAAIPNALECLSGLQMWLHKGTDLPCVPDLLPAQIPYKICMFISS